ncbi:subtilisin-like protease SBT3.5 [Phoenix dactylifera]|uniref:Subtilisin-like protease SBT3.5 n=1 Tax=Phoenix dactylifera TaxID=42345 RepID=A0A8B9A6C2_PHODC|nr:subtilisin-like protease SBT3.5 [Phoenix dactylifera]
MVNPPLVRKLYIVYLGERKHEDPNHATASHHDLLTSILGSYKHGFSGLAAMLTESQAALLAGSKILQSNMGRIWPESKSFNDDGYGPIPSRWKGICEVGAAFDTNNCSRKIIGARYYTAGISERNLKNDFLSPRDANGHGTFTASTAAGSIVENVSFHGLGAGVARGGAPRARLAIYKAVWGTGRGRGAGNSATVLKAIDDAIHDGVDILSLSLTVDEESFGSLHAVAKGITVVYSAGNQGPMPQTLSNTAPWVITVAASTIDRSFPTVITLGDHQSFVGQSIFYSSTKDHPKSKFKPLAYGDSCTENSLNGTNLAGTIVLCVAALVSPTSLFSVALSNVLKAGGEGLIFAQYTTNFLVTTQGCEGIPCVLVDFETANQIFNYIDSASDPMVSVELTRNVVGKEVLSPKVAAFSSRGPAILFPGLLKPDIAAPGVSILAARRNSYMFGSGTSAACPHVSGVVALLKSLHPEWSHAAIRSALVTTASITNGFGMPIQAEGLPRKIADPFDYGGGHIDPNKAADPGLIYDINPKDYYKFFNCTLAPFQICGSELEPLYYLNLPSIAIPNLKDTVTIWRTVTNVGKVDAIYEAVLQPPPGVHMLAEPSTLEFNAENKMRTFKVTFTSIHKVQGDYMFGSLTWWDGFHSVRIPIAIRVVIEDFYADTA